MSRVWDPFFFLFPFFPIASITFLAFFGEKKVIPKTATSGAMDSGNYYSRCCRNFASSCVFIAQLKYFSCISPVINFTGKNMKVIYLQKEYFKMSAFFNFHGERYNNWRRLLSFFLASRVYFYFLRERESFEIQKFSFFFFFFG